MGFLNSFFDALVEKVPESERSPDVPPSLPPSPAPETRPAVRRTSMQAHGPTNCQMSAAATGVHLEIMSKDGELLVEMSFSVQQALRLADSLRLHAKAAQDLGAPET